MALRKEQPDNSDERAIENNQQSAEQDRVPVEINRELYLRARIEANRKHTSISEYLEQLLDKIIPEMDKLKLAIPGHPPTQESIDKLREFREQLFRENNYQYFSDSVEEIRQTRGNLSRQLMGEDYDNE